MFLFGTEPVVFFRNETDCRRFRRNARKGEGEEGGEEGRGEGWTVGGEGGFTVYSVQKDGLGEGGGGREVPSAQTMTRIKQRKVQC